MSSEKLLALRREIEDYNEQAEVVTCALEHAEADDILPAIDVMIARLRVLGAAVFKAALPRPEWRN